MLPLTNWKTLFMFKIPDPLENISNEDVRTFHEFHASNYDLQLSPFEISTMFWDLHSEIYSDEKRFASFWIQMNHYRDNCEKGARTLKRRARLTLISAFVIGGFTALACAFGFIHLTEM